MENQTDVYCNKPHTYSWMNVNISHFTHTYPTDIWHIWKNKILGYCENYKYVLHRETVESRQQIWKPRNSMKAMLPQSFGTSDSEILGVIVCQWWIPRRWMQASGLQPPASPVGLQAFSLHSSPWNSLRHLWHLDFWVWPTQELWQHCFHTVRKLPFSLMTSFSFSTLFPYCIAPAQHTFKYLTYTMIVGWTYFLFWYYIDVTTEIHIHVY